MAVNYHCDDLNLIYSIFEKFDCDDDAVSVKEAKNTSIKIVSCFYNM